MIIKTNYKLTIKTNLNTDYPPNVKKSNLE